MRRLLLITTAIVALGASPARADPITTAITGWLTSTFGATLGAAIAQIGGSILLSAASQALAGKPKQEQQRSELTRPTSLPAYRYVYGTCWAPGTPVGWQVVGNILYICYLLNSRPSSLTTHSVLFDKRSVSISGDPFDFAGAGASATNDVFSGHVRYWIGRGDQTSAPAQVVAEASDFAATDAWRGCTVLWARLDCGDNDERSSRWPATPPELNVEGPWSLVYDPRDGLTKHSRNQGLIVLDALLNAPTKPHATGYVRMDTFAWAADVSDQQVSAKAGGTIARYRCDGVLVWSQGAELEDQIQPLLDAGASRLTRIGGQVAIIPGIARPAVYTVTDCSDGQAMTLEKYQPLDGLYTEAEASYISPARAYETAAAPVYVVDGAQSADGGLANRMTITLDFVTDHRQAQRLAKIAVMRSRMQRTISAELFPAAFDLVAGSICDVSLPAPFGPWNGRYLVEEINAASGINDDQSITLRLPVRLREEQGAAIYGWDAATEEQDVADAILSTTVARITPPASVTLATGTVAAIASGGTVLARVRAVWPATTGASATGYEWEYRVGSGDWQPGGSVAIGADRVGFVSPVVIGSSYTVRVRTVGLYGRSTWVTSSPIIAAGPAATVGTPSIRSATGGVGQVSLVLDQANDQGAIMFEVWRAAVNNTSFAALITTINLGPSGAIGWVNTGLSAGTYYYWGKAKDQFGNVSAFSTVKSATAT